MKYRVVISNDKNEVISDEIWYGNSLENIKFWVSIAIKDIKKELPYKKLYYVIEEKIEY